MQQRTACSAARRQLPLAAGLSALQQATGIAAIVAYSDGILQAAGFSQSAALSAACLPAACSLLGALAGAIAIDRCGRRQLLLISGVCSAIAMLLLSAALAAAQGAASPRVGPFPPWPPAPVPPAPQPEPAPQPAAQPPWAPFATLAPASHPLFEPLPLPVPWPIFRPEQPSERVFGRVLDPGSLLAPERPAARSQPSGWGAASAGPVQPAAFAEPNAPAWAPSWPQRPWRLALRLQSRSSSPGPAGSCAAAADCAACIDQRCAFCAAPQRDGGRDGGATCEPRSGSAQGAAAWGAAPWTSPAPSAWLPSQPLASARRAALGGSEPQQAMGLPNPAPDVPVRVERGAEQQQCAANGGELFLSGCPTGYAPLALVGLAAFILAFGPGMGGVPQVLSSVRRTARVMASFGVLGRAWARLGLLGLTWARLGLLGLA